MKKDKRVFYVDGATTVCLLVKEGEVVARGLAIASRADEFDPAEGRKYALARAHEAIGREGDCAPINIDAPRAAWTDRIHMQLAIDRFGYYKGYYRPLLTPTEYLILAIKNGNH
jgi:hypothetical protein